MRLIKYPLSSWQYTNIDESMLNQFIFKATKITLLYRHSRTLSKYEITQYYLFILIKHSLYLFLALYMVLLKSNSMNSKLLKCMLKQVLENVWSAINILACTPNGELLKTQSSYVSVGLMQMDLFLFCVFCSCFEIIFPLLLRSSFPEGHSQPL